MFFFGGNQRSKYVINKWICWGRRVAPENDDDDDGGKCSKARVAGNGQQDGGEMDKSWGLQIIKPNHTGEAQDQDD